MKGDLGRANGYVVLLDASVGLLNKSSDRFEQKVPSSRQSSRHGVVLFYALQTVTVIMCSKHRLHGVSSSLMGK